MEGMRNPSVPVTSRGPKVLLDVATVHQGGPRAVKAEGSEGSQGGISFCERHLAAHPAGNWRTWESCHQTSLFLWLARCLAGWHLALLRGEKPLSVLLGGEKGGVAQRQSVLSHSKSLLPFESLDQRRWQFAQLLLSGFMGGDVFSYRRMSLTGLGIVTEWSRILKYSGVNPECFPKIFLSK